MDRQKLFLEAKQVLDKNDLGHWTQPAPGLYPHQWLWDSCFIAIGLRHLNVERARLEILSILKGQWKNGMVPHIIFSEAKGYHAGPWLWQSHVSKNSPENMQTTGITQPPVLAEAVWKIGEKLPEPDRLAWFEEVYPALASYHEWLYRERDPKQTGLVAVVHPWETGLDNTPPWMELLHKYSKSDALYYADKIGITKFIELFRKDTSIVPPNQRMSTYDLYAVYNIVKRLHKHKYDDSLILEKEKILLQDLSFNSILIRANEYLYKISRLLNEELPTVVSNAHKGGVGLLEEMWSQTDKEYYSIDYTTGQQIKVSSIATLLPLYAGKISNERKVNLLESLKNKHTFNTSFPLPSAPINSPYFQPECYWQGPTWININWMVIEGLKNNGCYEDAEALKNKTLKMVAENGMSEYFSPLDGTPAGISDFSWTAGLIIDLLKSEK